MTGQHTQKGRERSQVYERACTRVQACANATRVSLSSFRRLYKSISAEGLPLSIIEKMTIPGTRRIGMRLKEEMRFVRARECMRSYCLTGDRLLGVRCMHLLSRMRGARVRSALFKAAMRLGEYHRAVRIGRGTAEACLAMAAVAPQAGLRALLQMSCDGHFKGCKTVALAGALHALVAAEEWRGLECQKGVNCDGVPYYECIVRACSRDHLMECDSCLLACARVIKLYNLKKAYEMVEESLKRKNLMKIQVSSEMLFENCILKCLVDSDTDRLSILYACRKRFSGVSALIAQEIAYFKFKPFEIRKMALRTKGCAFEGLYWLKEAVRRDCNRNGCCSDCKRLYSWVRARAKQEQRDGDFYLLDYFVFQDRGCEGAAYYFEPSGGFYWPRLPSALPYEQRVRTALFLARLDLLGTPQCTTDQPSS